MTEAGGVRPPEPTIVGAIGVAGPTGVTVGPTMSVCVRLSNALEAGSHVGVHPGLNSETAPETTTAVPTAAVAGGAEPVKMKMPSEVAALASGSGSWNQKPFAPLAV